MEISLESIVEHGLLASILWPLAVGLGLLAVPSERWGRWMACTGLAIPFGIVLYILTLGSRTYPRWAHEYDWGLAALGIRLSLGLDPVSAVFLLLTVLVGTAAGGYALYWPTHRKNAYWGLLLVVYAGLLGMFSCQNLFLFYAFHEWSLLATFLLMGLWAGDWKRSIAMEMAVYLTLGAMITLGGLLLLYSKVPLESFDWNSLRAYLILQPLGSREQTWIAGLLLVGLGILVSLFPFHTWAPKAYATMPCSAAMLHAGVLKKFGLYGLLQIGLPLLGTGMSTLQPWLISLALGNVLVVGWITTAQRDLKHLVGYSSVMHMGYAFLAVACGSLWGASATVMLLFGHGLSVALLLLLADVLQKRSAQGLYLAEYHGLGPSMPVLAGFTGAAFFANLGLPGFAGFWGELTLFVALWSYNPLICALAMVGIVISAVYGLRAFSILFFGTRSASLPAPISGLDLQPQEFWPAFFLLACLVGAGVWPQAVFSNLGTFWQQRLAPHPAPHWPAPLVEAFQVAQTPEPVRDSQATLAPTFFE